MVDLSLACKAADLASFEAEWKGYAQDAGITSEGDKIRLVGWLKARMASILRLFIYLSIAGSDAPILNIFAWPFFIYVKSGAGCDPRK